MPSLLIVDDEPSVLTSLTFLFKRHGYDVLAAEHPEKALEQVASLRDIGSLGVVISDYRMPTMSGIELLHEIAKFAPEAKRILLTAKSDLVTVMDAVNEGGLYRFLTKPCSYELLLRTVEEAFLVFNSAQENRQLNEELRQANIQLRSLSKKLEARVEHTTKELRAAIYFDRLTGLPSIELMHDRLAVAIQSAIRSAQTITVIYIGIENFSLINENLGHKIGNDLLCAFAARLEALIWEGDSAGRMHGDRFALIISNTAPGEPANELITRLLGLLQQPFQIGEQQIYLDANFGIAFFPEDGSSPQALLSHAEVAMHQARKDPDASYRFYSEDINRQSNERFILHSQIRAALENGEFKVHYQPRINVITGKIIGVEALLRWQHPERGLLPPAEFLYALEETGLIRQAGEWVLNEVCKSVVEWQAEVGHSLHVAVNVSPIQLKAGDFRDLVEKAIEHSKLDLSKTTLELEITENIFLSDMEQVREQLNSLRQMGIKIAIDDFGTGYSSLSYLIKLPIHYLKIDRTFVIDITKSRDAKAIVRAITSLAQSLRLQVVAEGIETEDQLEAMRTLDCEEFQGFLFSRPVSADAMRQLLIANSRNDSSNGKLFKNQDNSEEQFYV
ncbi:MAG: EAL domain-containing protein [Gammaproteobacteria bacterium]|nr:EAL domain-containing protein [Gammaproteobacteria bacterium]